MIALLAIAQNGPLAWDESVFATRARDLLEIEFSFDVRSGIYWGDHRPPGLPMILSGPFWVFGPSDLVARAVVVAAGVMSLVLLGRLLDLFFDRHVGTFAVALCAFCPGVLASSTLVFGDVPSTPFVLVGLTGLSRALLDRRDAWLLLVPPSLIGATIVRFGAVMLVAAPLVILGAWFLVDRLRERNFRSVGRLIVTAVASLAGIATVLFTTLLTRVSTPFDATRALAETNGGQPGRWRTDLADILQPGPVDYGFGGSFWGLSYAVLFCAVALTASLLVVFRGRWLRAGLAAAIAVTPVALYAVTVNQFVTTYFAPIFVSWSVAVCIGLFSNGRVSTPSAGTPSDDEEAQSGASISARSVATVLLVGCISAGVGISSARSTRAMHDRLDGFGGVRDASVIAGDLLGRPCALGTVRYPQVAWYSDCATVSLGGLAGLFDGADDDAEVSELQRRAGSVESFGVLLVDGPAGQPSIENALGALDSRTSVLLTDQTGRRVFVGEITAPPKADG